MFDANHDYQLDDFTVPDDESIIFEDTEFEDDDVQFESDATMQEDEDEDEPVLITDVQAGYPTNVSSRRFEAFMEIFKTLINPHTEDERLSASWSDFNKHISRLPRLVRIEIRDDIEGTLVEGITDFCDGWLYAQGQDSTFMTRAKLHAEMSNALRFGLRGFVGKWFPAEFRQYQDQGAIGEAWWREYIRARARSLDMVPGLDHSKDCVPVGEGPAIRASLLLWACVLDMFVARFFERYIRERLTSIAQSAQ